MTTETHPQRVPLSREAIVVAALALADEAGLETVSFRRLAGELGVTPMALYRYVGSKDELLGAMMEQVFAEFEFPGDTSGDWREDLRAFARAFRRLLLAHPAAAPLYFADVDTVFLNGLRIVEALLGVLRSAGFDAEQAALLEGSLERQVLALVLFERRAAGMRTEEEQAAHVRGQRARLLTLAPGEFPRILDAVDVFCGATVDPEQAFELALDLLIGGLERLLAASR